MIRAGDVVYLGHHRTLCMWSCERPDQVILPVRAAGEEIHEYKLLAKILMAQEDA